MNILIDLYAAIESSPYTMASFAITVVIAFFMWQVISERKENNKMQFFHLLLTFLVFPVVIFALFYAGFWFLGSDQKLFTLLYYLHPNDSGFPSTIIPFSVIVLIASLITIVSDLILGRLYYHLKRNEIIQIFLQSFLFCLKIVGIILMLLICVIVSMYLFYQFKLETGMYYISLLSISSPFLTPLLATAFFISQTVKKRQQNNAILHTPSQLTFLIFPVIFCTIVYGFSKLIPEKDFYLYFFWDFHNYYFPYFLNPLPVLLIIITLLFFTGDLLIGRFYYHLEKNEVIQILKKSIFYSAFLIAGLLLLFDSMRITTW